MGTLDKIQIIYEVLKKAGNIDAQKALLYLKEGNLKTQDENLDLKDRIRKLEEELKVKGEMEFDGIVYWLKDGDTKKGPYCRICYERDGKVIHIENQGTIYYCKVCKNGFSKTNVKKKWPLTSY